MLQSSSIDFLSELKANNNREWFQDNKKRFQAAKADFEQLIGELIKEIATFDPGVAHLEPKKCIFRIYRDVRFSKNKEPYKTNMGGLINAAGRKSMTPGYYIHLEPGEGMLAGGMYMPPGPWIKAVRQEVDYNLDEFRAIIDATDFKEQFGELDGERLKTQPKGYEKTHPGIDILRLKSFLAVKRMSDKDFLKKNFVQQASRTYQAMKPLNDFLNRAIAEVPPPAGRS